METKKIEARFSLELFEKIKALAEKEHRTIRSEVTALVEFALATYHAPDYSQSPLRSPQQPQSQPQSAQPLWTPEEVEMMNRELGLSPTSSAPAPAPAPVSAPAPTTEPLSTPTSPTSIVMPSIPSNVKATYKVESQDQIDLAKQKLELSKERSKQKQEHLDNQKEKQENKKVKEHAHKLFVYYQNHFDTNKSHGRKPQYAPNEEDSFRESELSFSYNEDGIPIKVSPLTKTEADVQNIIESEYAEVEERINLTKNITTDNPDDYPLSNILKRIPYDNYDNAFAKMRRDWGGDELHPDFSENDWEYVEKDIALHIDDPAYIKRSGYETLLVKMIQPVWEDIPVMHQPEDVFSDRWDEVTMGEKGSNSPSYVPLPIDIIGQGKNKEEAEKYDYLTDKDWVDYQTILLPNKYKNIGD